MGKRKIPSTSKPAAPALQVDQLLGDLRKMIEAARLRVATAANAEVTLLYWRIGRKIHTEVFSGRAQPPTANQFLPRCRNNWSSSTAVDSRIPRLTRMAGFFVAFPEEAIVATLSQQLSWSHFRELLPLKQPLQREYYAEMCRIERWSVRTLHQRIDSMLYERTALSRKPEELIERELESLRDTERVTARPTDARPLHARFPRPGRHLS